MANGSRFWFPVAFLAALAISVGLTLTFWGSIHPKTPGSISPIETIRNVGLVIGGLLAFLFAWWRALVAERQASAARTQVVTGQQSLLNERYQRATEMIGSQTMAVRLGGIYQLQRIADEHPEQYHIPVSQILCAFVRRPPEPITNRSNQSRGPFSHIPADILAALTAIGDRDHEGRQAIELAAGYRPDFRDAELPGADLIALNLSLALLENANLSGAALLSANLVNSSLWGADLTEADLNDAMLLDAELMYADLTGANFVGADLAGAVLSGATFSDAGQNPALGLTQSQIDNARAELGEPPILDGVSDSVTGELLIWDGFPL